MTQRRDARALRRERHHAAQLREAKTTIGKLRIWSGRLVAEVSRTSNRHRITEVTLAIVDLVYRLQKRLPLPEPAHGSPAADDPNCVSRGFRPARGTTRARRDVA